MTDINYLSLLWLDDKKAADLPPQTIVDLDLASLAAAIAIDQRQRRHVMRLLSRIPLDAETVRFRQQILADLLANPTLLQTIARLLPDVDELGTQHTRVGKRATLFEVVARLNELELYVEVVTSLGQALADVPHFNSPVLERLRGMLQQLRDDRLFKRLQQELPPMLASMQRVAAVTIGVNLDFKLRPVAATLLQLHEEPFRASTLWQRLMGDMPGGLHELPNMTAETLVKVMGRNKRELNPLMVPLFRDLADILEKTSRPIARALQRYKSLNAAAIVNLHDDFAFYVGAARLIVQFKQRGLSLCQPQIVDAGHICCRVEGGWNMHLGLQKDEVVANDFELDESGRILLVTGPNGGGKTTFLQTVAVTQLLAQLGLNVAAQAATVSLVDNIYTHYQVEERPSEGLGRFGEEAKRLYLLFSKVTAASLVLLNEPLTSTSAGESLYLLQDIVRLFDQIGLRAALATHLHELAAWAETQQSAPTAAVSLVASPIRDAEPAGNRSYKVERSAPLGRSYARELAARHGVEYVQLQTLLQKRDVL